MASGDLPYVFDRFWRSSHTTANFPYGTGIGLAITKRLVELQGGRIEVDSTLSQGSVFRFCLPKG